MNVAANNKTLCFRATYSKTDAVDTQQTRQIPDTRQIMPNDRMINADRLRGKVSENNKWSSQQPENLYNVLIKYQHLTEQPENARRFNTISRQKAAHTIVPILDTRQHTQQYQF